MTTDLPTDPTAFREAAIKASPDTPVGQKLEPITKRVTLDKSRIYQGWPAARNRHTDYAAAQATGLREPNINGGQTAEYLGELFMKFFGRLCRRLAVGQVHRLRLHRRRGDGEGRGDRQDR